MRQLSATAAAFLLVSTAFAADVRIGSWFVKNETDIATDKPTPRLFALADSGDQLSFLCDPRGPVINLLLPRMDFVAGNDPAVIWRIDDAPALAVLMGVGSAHLIGVGLGRQSYNAVSAAKRIRFRIELKSGAFHDVDFRLSKTAEAFRSLLAACPLSDAIDKPPHVYDPAADLFEQVPKPTPKPTPVADLQK